MGAINTRVVHRSNALQNARYGKEFTYDEAMIVGRGLQGRLTAYGITAALGGFFTASAFKPSRWVVEKFVPKPGEGPSPEAQEAGYYDLRFVGKTEDGKTIKTKVVGDRDDPATVPPPRCWAKPACVWLSMWPIGKVASGRPRR